MKTLGLCIAAGLVLIAAVGVCRKSSDTTEDQFSETAAEQLQDAYDSFVSHVASTDQKSLDM